MSEKTKYYYGVGRRKAATARAKYYPTNKDIEISVNKRDLKQYFEDFFQKTITGSLDTIGIKTGKVELFIKGGGAKGQAEAARLAIAKALLALDEGFRPVLRMNGYLTTDIRKVLPKRPGLRKARKREQWSKR